MENKLPTPARLLSEEIKSLRSFYGLDAEQMSNEIGAKIRLYRDLETGKYDKSKSGRQEKYWSSLRVLRETGPRYIRKGAGEDRFKKLEDEINAANLLFFSFKVLGFPAHGVN